MSTILKMIWRWINATRLRKILSLTLAILILFTSIRFIFLKPKIALADSTLGFDEGYGTTVTDGNNTLSGTITGAAWKSEEYCKVGKCLYFDGTEDKINFGNDSDVNFTTGSFTIEGWFRVPDISNVKTLAVKYDPTTGTDGGYKVYLDTSGYLVFGIDNDNGSFPSDSASTSTTAFDDNKWHHFAAVKNGTTSITLYVDGIQYQTDSSITASSLTNTDSFFVGIEGIGAGSGNDFLGFIDEVKVYSGTARSASEIKADLTGETASRGTSASFGPEQDYLSDGLVGYWKMEESAGNSCTGGTNDSCNSSGIGSSLDLAWTNNTTTTTGKFGNGTVYDGTDDYASCTDANCGGAGKLDFTNSDSFTYSTWVKSSYTGAGQFLIGKKSRNLTTIAGYMLNLNVTTGTAVCALADGTNQHTEESSNSYTDGNWHMVTCVYDGNEKTLKVYGDGVRVDDGTNFITASSVTGSFDGTSDFATGIQTNNLSFDLNGSLDQVRVYNRALSGAEVQKLYSWAPGPVGYWKMDENTGTTVADTSGNGYISSTFTGNTTWTTGKFGGGIVFDGTDDNVRIVEGTNIDLGALTDSYTISAWVNYSSCAVDCAIVAKMISSSSAYPFNLYIDSAKMPYFSTRDSSGNVSTAFLNSAISANTWYHLSAVRDVVNDKVYLYVNGSLSLSSQTATDASTASNTNNDNISMGTSGGGDYLNNDLAGRVDDVKIYNYARTPGQIIEDMNGDHPAPGSPIGSATAYWNFDEGYGTTAYDASINANNLTLSTASWTNSGKFGKAFNGLTNVRASVADDANDEEAFDFAGADNATFSLWFKSDSATNPSANEYLLEKGGNIATDAIGYAIYTSSASDGLICFGIDDDATTFPEDEVCSTSDLYDNTWHHIIATKIGTSRLDLYVDGKRNGTPDTTVSSTGTLANAATFYIGDTNGTDGTDEFLGDIDEVKIYRLALTSDQVKAEYNQGSMTVMGSTSTDSTGVATWSDTNSYCPPGQGSTCTAPIGQWQLNENSGTTAYDTSENDNDAALTNSPTWVTGKKGQALDLNGSTQCVTDATPTSIVPLTGDMSISTWVYRDTTTTDDYISDLSGTDETEAENRNYSFYINDTNHLLRLEWEYGAGTDEMVSSSVGLSNASGTWVHIAATRNIATNEVKFYENGRQLGSTVSYTNDPTGGTSDQRFVIGHEDDTCPSNTNAFDGKVDELKLFNIVRTPAQIAWDYNRGGPIAHWQFDEGSGGTANDISGNSNTGTLSIGGSGTQTTTTQAWSGGSNGKINSSLNFDGTDDLVYTANSYTSASLQRLSVSAWIKTTNASGKIVVSFENTQSNEFSTDVDRHLYVDTNGKAVFGCWDGSSAHTLLSSQNVNDGIWHHLLGTFDTDTDELKFYVDGVLQETETSTQCVFDGGSPGYWRIGSFNNGAWLNGANGYFTGQIDDVRIYNYPLNLNQIKLLYNDGSAVKF